MRAPPPSVTDMSRPTTHGHSATSGTGEREPAAAPPSVRALPLLATQRRLWLMEELEPGTAAYNVVMPIRLRGQLAPEALEHSLSELVARHESLRTSFGTLDGEPAQYVAGSAPLRLVHEDVSRLAVEIRDHDAGSLVDEDARMPFNLSTAPLLRARLVRLAPRDHLLILTAHHLVIDGWSQRILFKELGELYRAAVDGAAFPLAPVDLCYSEYVHRQWQSADPRELGQKREHWRRQLAGAPPLLELPGDRPRPMNRSTAGARRTRPLSEELKASIERFARGERVTVFMVMLAAFNVILGRYARTDDVVVGTPMAGRLAPDTTSLVGFFVNTVPLRTSLAGDPSFRELLVRVRETTLAAHANQALPFEQLVDEIRPERSLSHTPIVQITLALDRHDVQPLQLPGIRSQLLAPDNPPVRFDLEVTISDTPEELLWEACYRTDLLEEATIDRLLASYETLLEAAIADPERPVHELPLVGARDTRRILRHFNRTRAPYPDTLCVHDLVAAQAARTPDAIAIVHRGRRLGYRALDQRANRLAEQLRDRGVGRGSVVAVFVERSPEMIVAQLAVLKCGAAYVPLDTSYPAERVAFILDDCQATVLIGDPGLGLARSAAVVPVGFDGIDPPAGARRSEATTDDVAYVIYTSGSTGRPKGAEITHRGLVNLIAWHNRAYGITPEDRATQVAATAFDASVWEIWPYLSVGASVHLADDRAYASTEELARWLIEERITVTFLPTPLAELVLDEPALVDSSLRYMLTGGDTLRRRPPKKLPFALVNHYGPSEATVVTTAITVEAGGHGEPPIGRPIDNVQVFVLDDRLRPVPVGVPGELHVAGVGLARRYLGRPELTSERFIPNPFSTEAGARLYRTGDLVRWRDDGALEFLGRRDQQVKLRGFRVELGEIEAALMEHQSIAETAVAVRDDSGQRRLVAYIVARDGGAPAVSDLRQCLGARLPSYMIPSDFVTVPALPLSPNGKVDRSALPAPSVAPGGGGPTGSPPRDRLEAELLELWRGLLGVDSVAIDDDFFAVGGNSLLATRLVAGVRAQHGVSLTVSSVFEHTTLREFADHMRAKLASGQRQPPPIRRAKAASGRYGRWNPRSA